MEVRGVATFRPHPSPALPGRDAAAGAKAVAILGMPEVPLLRGVDEAGVGWLPLTPAMPCDAVVAPPATQFSNDT